jgi:tetratricopeptide (TPR) repeat protein
LGSNLFRFSLAARQGVWYITEIEDADDGELSFTEPLQAVFNPAMSVVPLRHSTHPERALKQLEQVLATKGESAPLLLLKANLLRTKQLREVLEEGEPGKSAEVNQPQPETRTTAQQPAPPDEAQLLLESITTRWPEYAPAHYVLANSYDEEAWEKALASFQRYAQLMPLDPRPWENLAFLYDEMKRPREAEMAYRETIARDRENIERHAELIVFYLHQAQMEKAKASVAEAFKYAPAKSAANSVFKAVDLLVMHDDEEEPSQEMTQRLEELLLSFPKELSASIDGLRGLSEAQRAQQKYDAAIKTLQKVMALDSAGGDQVTIASIHREAKRYSHALIAADQAIKQDRENAGAHYERACALAQLRRQREALVALRKALELDADYAYEIADEPDLQPLTGLPDFKALLPKDEEPAEANAKSPESKAAKP